MRNSAILNQAIELATIRANERGCTATSADDLFVVLAGPNGGYAGRIMSKLGFIEADISTFMDEHRCIEKPEIIEFRLLKLIGDAEILSRDIGASLVDTSHVLMAFVNGYLALPKRLLKSKGASISVIRMTMLQLGIPIPQPVNSS